MAVKFTQQQTVELQAFFDKLFRQCTTIEEAEYIVDELSMIIQDAYLTREYEIAMEEDK